MKKLIIAAAAVLFVAGAAYAEQACFYGKDCKDGKVVASADDSSEKGTWAKKDWSHKKMMQKGDCKECPMAKEGKCPMMKEGKGCPMMKEKMMKGKAGRKCTEKTCKCADKKDGKPCSCKKNKKK